MEKEEKKEEERIEESRIMEAGSTFEDSQVLERKRTNIFDRNRFRVCR